MMYCMKGGITYGEIQDMLGVDREWHLSRLLKQLKLEEEEAKKMKNKIKSKSRKH